MLKKIKYNNFEMIWIFYASSYYLFYSSSLKNDFNVSLLLSACTFVTLALLLIVNIIQGQYSKKYFKYYIIAAILIAMWVFIQKSITILVLFLFIWTARKEDFKKLILIDAKLKLFWTIIFIVLWALGILQNVSGTYGSAEYATEKMSLGFQHPNTFTFFVLSIVLELVCYYFKRLRLIHFFVATVIFIITMMISKSRTSGFIFLLALIGMLIIKYFPKLIYNKFLSDILSATPWLALAFSVSMTILYIKSNPLAIMVNKLFTGRILRQAIFWNHFNITLFGQSINEVEYVLDCAYIKYLLRFGLIFTICLCFIYMLLIYKALKRRQGEIALLFMFYVLYGIGESSMFFIACNFTLMAWLNPNEYRQNVFDLPIKRTIESKKCKDNDFEI